MKKFLLVMGLITAVISVSAQVINDPNVTPRDAGSFNAIKISDAFDVYLTQSTSTALAVSAAEKEYIGLIKTDVSGNTLKVWYDGKGRKGWNTGKLKLKVYISFKELNKLDISGACDVYFLNSVKLDELNVILSGASDVKGDALNISRMDVHMSGASDVKIGGKVGKLKISASGASDFKGYELEADYCDVNCSGASGIYITINKEISADLSGASDVYYKGAGTISSVKSSGSSSITRKS